MTTTLSITTNEEQESQNHPLGYCDDLNHYCHWDSEYHRLTTNPPVGEQEIEAAYSFLEIARAA